MTTDSEQDTPETADAGGESSVVQAPETTRDWIELVSTILLAVAAIAAAWAGFQAAKWGGVQATSFSEAGANRTESTRSSTTAGQEAQIDVAMFIEWLSAAQDDLESGRIPDPTGEGDVYEPTPGTLSGFLFERFRDEFRPAVDAWIATGPFGNPDAPASPFEMEEYVLASDVEAEELRLAAEEAAETAREANQTSDDYVVTTVLFALALFFIAIAGKFESVRVSMLSLGLGVIVLVGTIIRVVSLPIEF